MHRRELRADGPTAVLDLLAFDPNGTLRVLAETREPKGKIGSFDSHAGLKDATLRAAGESRRCIESGTTSPKGRLRAAQDQKPRRTLRRTAGTVRSSCEWMRKSETAMRATRTQSSSGPLQALTSRDIRTGAMAKKFLLPWNWFRGAFVIDASAKLALGA